MHVAYEGKGKKYSRLLGRVFQKVMRALKDRYSHIHSLMRDSTMEILMGIKINEQVELVKVSYERCIHPTVLDLK